MIHLSTVLGIPAPKANELDPRDKVDKNWAPAVPEIPKGAAFYLVRRRLPFLSAASLSLVASRRRLPLRVCELCHPSSDRGVTR